MIKNDFYRQWTVKRQMNITYIYTGIDADRDKDFFFPGEAHNFWELVYVSDGEITATADERIYNLKEGMLLFHKPMEFHRLIANGKTSSHLKIISFSAEGELINHFADCCFNLNLSEQDLFTEINTYFVKACGGENFNDFSGLAVSLLEVFLLKLKSKKDYKPKRLSYSEDLYYRIVKTLKDNCDKSLTVNDIADMLNMSTSNIKRVFSLYSDIGIAKYFLKLKLRRAMELLNDGMPPSRVAAELDFKQNYFYTVFKREVGTTPYKYSKSGE